MAGVAGALATDYAISTLTNGKVDFWYDITTGVIVGLGVSIPEAAATGLAVAGGAEIAVLGEVPPLLFLTSRILETEPYRSDRFEVDSGWLPVTV